MIKEYSFEEIITKDIPPKEFYKTGTRMDEFSKGFAKGELHCICGATNSGKSLTIIHLLFYFSLQGYKTCIVSLENDDSDDIERFRELFDSFTNYIDDEQYGNLINNLKYYNASTEGTKEKATFIINKLEENEIVLVDGTEFLISGSTPVEVNENGRKLMNEFRNYCRTNNSTIIMSWQTNRLGGGKSLEELIPEDMSGSMSVPQQCYSIWILKQWREKNSFKWKLRLLKSRKKYDFSNSIMDVFNNETKEFNLR